MAITLATVELIRMAIYLGGYMYVTVSQLIEIAQGAPIPDEELQRLKNLNASQDERAKAMLPGYLAGTIPSAMKPLEIAAVIEKEKTMLVDEVVTRVMKELNSGTRPQKEDERTV